MYDVVLNLCHFLNPIPQCTRMYLVWYINTGFRTSRYILSSVCTSRYILVYTFGKSIYRYIPGYTIQVLPVPQHSTSTPKIVQLSISKYILRYTVFGSGGGDSRCVHTLYIQCTCFGTYTVQTKVEKVHTVYISGLNFVFRTYSVCTL